jgi:hypothetical protein
VEGVARKTLICKIVRGRLRNSASFPQTEFSAMRINRHACAFSNATHAINVLRVTQETISVSVDLDNDQLPPWLDMESVQKLSVVEKITSLSPESLRRVYPSLIVKLSERRDGMKLKHALAIASGTAERG